MLGLPIGLLEKYLHKLYELIVKSPLPLFPHAAIDTQELYTVNSEVHAPQPAVAAQAKCSSDGT